MSLTGRIVQWNQSIQVKKKIFTKNNGFFLFKLEYSWNWSYSYTASVSCGNEGLSEESKMLWMKFQKHYHWAYLYSFNLHMAPNASEYRICTWNENLQLAIIQSFLKMNPFFEKGGRDSKGKKSWSLKNIK